MTTTRRTTAQALVHSMVGRAVRSTATVRARTTGAWHMRPDYLVIGAQRAGTTTLYKHLVKHPSVGPALTKEVHFFDKNFGRGFPWYAAHFPTVLYERLAKRPAGWPLVTGEATPYYLFHPHAPHRVAECLPTVKLVVMLRDPANRAYSHYQHEVARGDETLSFEEAIDKEQERVEGELDKMLADPTYNSFVHQHYTYLSRGIYVDQLEVWRSLFPESQMHVISSEEFFSEPERVLTGLLDFLGLPRWLPPSFKRHNSYRYSKLDDNTRARLAEYYAEPNQRLYEYLGVDYGWCRNGRK